MNPSDEIQELIKLHEVDLLRFPQSNFHQQINSHCTSHCISYIVYLTLCISHCISSLYTSNFILSLFISHCISHIVYLTLYTSYSLPHDVHRSLCVCHVCPSSHCKSQCKSHNLHESVHVTNNLLVLFTLFCLKCNLVN